MIESEGALLEYRRTSVTNLLRDFMTCSHEFKPWKEMSDKVWQNITNVRLFFFSCRDKEKANKAQETVECVVELTQKFQDAVLIVRDKVRGDMSTVEASLSFTSHAEKMVLLQREWSAKVKYAQVIVITQKAEFFPRELYAFLGSSIHFPN